MTSVRTISPISIFATSQSGFFLRPRSFFFFFFFFVSVAIEKLSLRVVYKNARHRPPIFRGEKKRAKIKLILPPKSRLSLLGSDAPWTPMSFRGFFFIDRLLGSLVALFFFFSSTSKIVHSFISLFFSFSFFSFLSSFSEKKEEKS